MMDGGHVPSKYMHQDEKFWIQERRFLQIEKGRVITL
jgi:hypothetical protein